MGKSNVFNHQPRKLSFCFFACALVVFTKPCIAEKPIQQSYEKAIKLFQERYRTWEHYEVSGNILVEKNNGLKGYGSFRFLSASSERTRFEYKEDFNIVIVSEGEQCDYYASYRPRVERSKDYRKTLGRFAGVSKRASTLHGDVFQNTEKFRTVMKNVNNSTFNSEQTIENIRCCTFQVSSPLLNQKLMLSIDTANGKLVQLARLGGRIKIVYRINRMAEYLSDDKDFVIPGTGD